MENSTTSLRLVPGAWKDLLSKFDTHLAHRLVILNTDPDPDPDSWSWSTPTSMTFSFFHSKDISISSPDRFITSCSKLRTLYLSGWVVSFYNWSTLLWFWKALLMTLIMSSYLIIMGFQSKYHSRSIWSTGRWLPSSQAGAGLSCGSWELPYQGRGCHHHYHNCKTVQLQGRLSKKAYLGLIKHCPLLHRVNLSSWNIPRYYVKSWSIPIYLLPGIALR